MSLNPDMNHATQTAAGSWMRSEVPPGRSGDWVIEKIDFPERVAPIGGDPRPDCFRYRSGRVTRLRCGEVDYMTDLYDEWWTQTEAIEQASARGGRVLLTGLGLGLVAEAILRHSERVEGITIVERSPEVIDLVAPYLGRRYGSRIEIVHADAFGYRPSSTRFTVGWHDIWPDPHHPSVLDEVAVLKDRYRHVCDWQGSWPEAYRLAEKDMERQHHG